MLGSLFLTSSIIFFLFLCLTHAEWNGLGPLLKHKIGQLLEFQKQHNHNMISNGMNEGKVFFIKVLYPERLCLNEHK